MEKDILLDKPWIDYLNSAQIEDETFILSFPENVVFMAQYVVDHLDFAHKHIYNDRYPNAEKFNLDVLNDIDWKKTVITFDRDYNVIVAPDGVKNFINLDRRLRYERARKRIFGMFRFTPFLETFKLYWIVSIYVLMLIFLYRDTILHQIRRLNTWKSIQETLNRIPRFLPKHSL